MATSWKKTDNLLFALIFLYFSGVKGFITSPPQNTATKVGSQTHLNCSGNNSVLGWTFGDPGNTITLVTLGSLCNVASNYASSYRGEAQGSNTCNLIILNPSLQESGVYSCQDNDLAPKYAVLTVLSSLGTPTVNNSSKVVEGDQLRVTCTVEYGTSISVPVAPFLSWTISGINITNAETTKTNISVTSSITIVTTRDGIPSYDCTAHFLPPASTSNFASNAPSTVYIGATYPITGVYYAPTTPVLSRRIVNVTEHSAIVCAFSELTCSSSANPSPIYTWTNVTTGNVLANGNVLTLAEDNRTYRCTASNKVNSSHAAYTTGISQPRQCVPATTDNIRIFSDDGYCDNATNVCSCVNGSHVNLICNITNAYPLPSITWVDTLKNVLNNTFINATTSGNYTCQVSNQINILTNTTAAKSTRVTNCLSTSTKLSSPTTNLSGSPSVIIPAVVVPCWVFLNLIAMSVFLIYYNGRDPNGKYEHKKMLNFSFSWLKLMLPCLNESSDRGRSQCLWVFLFVLVSITLGLIVFPILLIKASCEFSANRADKLSNSTMPTSASNEMELRFSQLNDENDEDAARKNGQGMAPELFQTLEVRRDISPYKEWSNTIFPPSKTYQQENKETKQKNIPMSPNYAVVNKTKPRMDDDQKSKAGVPLPPINASQQSATSNPNAPLYGELNIALQSNPQRPAQLLTEETATQYASLKAT